VAFEFIKSSCVVVGTFNIYVVQPSLLTALNIVHPEKGDKIHFLTNLTQPGFRFSSPELNAEWTVRPDRIIVETTDPAKDCGADIARVLAALKWTPVTAIGINAEYHSNEWDSPLLPMLEAWTEDGLKGTELVAKQKTVHVAAVRKDGVFNVQMAQCNEGYDATVNVHVDAKGRGEQEATTQFIQDVASKFFDYRRDAQTLVKRLFLVELSDVIDSHQRPVADDGNDRESA